MLTMELKQNSMRDTNLLASKTHRVRRYFMLNTSGIFALRSGQSSWSRGVARGLLTQAPGL